MKDSAPMILTLTASILFTSLCLTGCVRSNNETRKTGISPSQTEIRTRADVESIVRSLRTHKPSKSDLLLLTDAAQSDDPVSSLLSLNGLNAACVKGYVERDDLLELYRQKMSRTLGTDAVLIMGLLRNHLNLGSIADSDDTASLLTVIRLDSQLDRFTEDDRQYVAKTLALKSESRLMRIGELLLSKSSLMDRAWVDATLECAMDLAPQRQRVFWAFVKEVLKRKAAGGR